MQATEIGTAGLSRAIRQRIRGYARRPGQMAFFHVVPTKSGLSRTICVSQNDDYPALLISPAPGRLVDPPTGVLVAGFDETTPFSGVNAWLVDNRHLLPPLARQQVDVGHFYDRMRKCEMP